MGADAENDGRFVESFRGWNGGSRLTMLRS